MVFKGEVPLNKLESEIKVLLMERTTESRNEAIRKYFRKSRSGRYTYFGD